MFLVLFFKQKTAYEMRISDWSSDVCSSDLMNTRKMGAYWSLAVQTVISGVIMYLVMFVMIDGLDSFYNNLNMLYMTLMMVAPMVVLMILAKIGRASCRERVCQYV